MIKTTKQLENEALKIVRKRTGLPDNKKANQLIKDTLMFQLTLLRLHFRNLLEVLGIGRLIKWLKK